MKNRKAYTIAALTGVALLLSASLASAAVSKVRAIPWQGDPTKYHTAIATESSSWNTSGSDNVLRVRGEAKSGSYISWIRAVITRGGSTERVCLYDVNGGNCTETNLCTASYSDAAFDQSTNIAASPIPDSITLEVLGTNCSSSRQVELLQNGVSVGGAEINTAYDCTCTPALQSPTLAGASGARLKGVIDTTNTDTVWYRWDFGDGSMSDVTALSGKTRYNVAANHAYSGTPGAPFTARLLVDGVDNSMTHAIADSYLVKLEADTLDARINVAIDEGLWWLYQQGNNLGGYASYPRTYDGSPYMTWLQTSYVYTLVTPTASAVHAFGINGHKMKGNVNEDPYVEAVQQGMNYLVKGYNLYPTYPALRASAISSVNHGGVIDNPEAGQAAPNGYGIEVYDWGGSHIPYQSGQIMDAIIASGVSPTDLTGRDFTRTDATVVRNWTYGELLQDMADMHAWGQSDSTGCNGGVCGSWWYGWNYGFPGDNSASQWGAIGMLPAQQPPWNVVVPAWVKNYNANWLAYSMGCSGPSAAVTSCSNNFFSYNGVGGCAGDNCQQTTTSGMVQMIFDGQTTADLKWGRAQKKIADEWRSFLHDGSNWGGYRTYGWYSFAKAMRLSLPESTTQLVKTGGASFDWYYGDPTTTACTTEANCEKGLAQRILETQAADGQWPSGNLTNPPLTTAWMIITLKPSLFASSPIACFDYSPKSTYSGDTVSFDPTCSGHSEPGKTIANLTKFEWDWDNDGDYDAETTTPDMVTNVFTCDTPPCTFPVTLRVTDDNDPALTATVKQNVAITNPPHPPTADAGGPYMTSLCPADSLTLDGSASFDPNEGEYEAGCTDCDPDTITAWEWDLTPPLTGFDDESGETVTVAPGTYFAAAGNQDVGLRVTDNTVESFPGSGEPNLTDTDFGTVAVADDCLCTLTARAKLNKVQLVWANTGAASYDIYRSTTGPNTGFSLIKDNLVTSYATYLDSGLTIGVPYWYRVVDSNGCGSVAVRVVPVSR
ncbi:MAG: hypothetical protein ACOY32_01245 [Thermodesulfobacteriota bacterium]